MNNVMESGLCSNCLLSNRYCVCDSRPELTSAVDFCLLMDAREPAKASNTGKLIADCLSTTRMFVWSRTEPDRVLLELLACEDHQVYLVFPGEYAGPSQPVVMAPDKGKRLLLIVLDATWPQARKMLRKSLYLQSLPVLSLEGGDASRYRLRRSRNAEHLCTVEVAKACLALVGEHENALRMDEYFERFSQAYLAARERRRSIQ